MKNSISALATDECNKLSGKPPPSEPRYVGDQLLFPPNQHAEDLVRLCLRKEWPKLRDNMPLSSVFMAPEGDRVVKFSDGNAGQFLGAVLARRFPDDPTAPRIYALEKLPNHGFAIEVEVLQPLNGIDQGRIWELWGQTMGSPYVEALQIMACAEDFSLARENLLRRADGQLVFSHPLQNRLPCIGYIADDIGE